MADPLGFQAGLAAGGFLVVTLAMLADAIADEARRTGHNREGVYSGFWLGVEKIAFAGRALAWCSLSADPPTMLACVNRVASAHEAIGIAGAFSINVLNFDHGDTVAIFSAQRRLNGEDRFLPGKWDSGCLGQPLVRHGVAVFEFRLT